MKVWLILWYDRLRIAHATLNNAQREKLHN